MGSLEDSGDARTPIRPIRSDPDVYELRHKALGKRLRFYHGEPTELPCSLVLLHRHIKCEEFPQQAQINFAVDRYRSGASDNFSDIQPLGC